MTGKLICYKASQIREEPITWLIPGVIPEKTLSIIFGLPKCGKSQIALDIAAAVSKGSRWANHDRAKSGNVIIMNMDEDPERAVKPRLRVAGANLERVSIVTGYESDRGVISFDPNKHLDALRREIGRLKHVKLIVIDPVYETSRSHTLAIADALREIAEEFDTSVLAVMHTRKAGGVTQIHKIAGSQAWGAKARAIWSVERHANGGLLYPVELSYAKPDTAFPFSIEPKSYKLNKTTFKISGVSWGDVQTYEQPSDVVTLRPKGKAVDELAKILAQGPVGEKDVRARLAELDISKSTVERAKKELGVVTTRGKGKQSRASFWSLPELESEAA